MTDKDIIATPIGFIEACLGLKLYPWQDKALASLENTSGRQKISVVTPNGSGKSERIVAGAALWWMAVHPRGKVVITTKDGRQLSEQIYPALTKHRDKFEGWSWVTSPHIKVTTPTGGSINAFTTDDPGRAEGWHKEDDDYGPLLIIVDEAKSVPEPIFDAFERCTYNAIMYVSSPGPMLGRFYDAFTKNRDQFLTVQAGLKDCPHIPKEKVDDIIKTYGEEHPFTRSSVYGEFMDVDDANKYIIPLSSLQRCLQNPPQFRGGTKFAFCDFAAGGDENVIAYRNGNKVTIEAAWRDANKLASVGRFIQHFRKLELKPEEVYGDAAAKDMCDMLAEAGWNIKRINFGQPASQSEIFLSWGAEAWLNFGTMVTMTMFREIHQRSPHQPQLGNLGVERLDVFERKSLHIDAGTPAVVP